MRNLIYGRALHRARRRHRERLIAQALSVVNVSYDAYLRASCVTYVDDFSVQTLWPLAPQTKWSGASGMFNAWDRL